jgi:shikimate dehydrogenase
VLGSPIAHSLSPALHRAAYAELGLDWEYDAYDVSEAELPGFVATLAPDVRGLSLTMPLKTAVIPLCDAVSRTGALLGSVNTLLIEPDQTRSGHNTDVPGLVAALHEAGVDGVRCAVLVGAGATAASALAAVAALGASSAEVLARNVARAARLVDVGDRLGVTVEVRHLDEVRPPQARTPAMVDLLVSTIPAAAQVPYAVALARRAEIVVDAIYDPARTPLLAAGEEAGARLVPGFALLLHQAARQVELMTGCEAAPLEAMRAAGLAALAAR